MTRRHRRPTAAARPRRLAPLAVVLLAALPAAGAGLDGVVEVVNDHGRALPGAAAEAVVWFVPDRPAEPPQPGVYEMVTRRKQFEPRVLVVPVGSTVRFPNRDPILHNVFSVSGRNAFDLGLVPKGRAGSHRFDSAGVVKVFCNVHHSMVAYVVVVDTPYHAVPDRDGRFHLRGLPSGAGTLTAWHPRGDPVSRRVDPARGAATALAVEASRPLVPPHLDKRGRPYARSRRGRY